MGVEHTDTAWMHRALELAGRAEAAGEVPVGALVVREGLVLSEGWNRPIGDHDPSAHAEIIALRAAARQCANYRLPGADLYVTLEPCAMCVGALVHARIRRVVFGATDPKSGAAGGCIDLRGSSAFHHSLTWEGGVLAAECGEQLRAFFRARRARSAAIS